MSSNKLRLYKKIGPTNLISLFTILFLAFSMIVAIIVLSSNYSFNTNEKAAMCECNQYDSCGTGYKCSNSTCGVCVVALSSKPTPKGQCSKLGQKCNEDIKCCGSMTCGGGIGTPYGNCAFR